MKPLRIKTISEFHQLNQLPPPEHPLISVVDYVQVAVAREDNPIQSTVADYYSIAVKRGLSGKMRYGQQEYDFDEGVMYFLAPGQVLQAIPEPGTHLQPSGWILLVHPNFLWNTSLAKTIKQYEYFDYSVNEALFLSEKEETILKNMIENIRQEYHSNIDKFSQNIIISQIETLLNYAERFYQRQFITRKITNHRILDGLEELLTNHFRNDDMGTKGLPTVHNIQCIAQLFKWFAESPYRTNYPATHPRQIDRKSQRKIIDY